jgi:hypothetical protein
MATVLVLVFYFLIAAATSAYSGYKLFKAGIAQGWSWATSWNAKLQALGTTLQALMIGAFWPFTGTVAGVKWLVARFKH